MTQGNSPLRGHKVAHLAYRELRRYLEELRCCKRAEVNDRKSRKDASLLGIYIGGYNTR